MPFFVYLTDCTIATNPVSGLQFGKLSNLAIGSEQQQSYLDALAFPQIDSRLLNIKKAHDKTCMWLLEQSEYKDWLDPNKIPEHHGFLWVKGKPGAGKSTMMKYALAHAR